MREKRKKKPSKQVYVDLIAFILPYNLINYLQCLNQKLLSLKLSVNGFCGRNLKEEILENGKSNFFDSCTSFSTI